MPDLKFNTLHRRGFSANLMIYWVVGWYKMSRAGDFSLRNLSIKGKLKEFQNYLNLTEFDKILETYVIEPFPSSDHTFIIAYILLRNALRKKVSLNIQM